MHQSYPNQRAEERLPWLPGTIIEGSLYRGSPTLEARELKEAINKRPLNEPLKLMLNTVAVVDSALGRIARGP